jgi:hypothetical protein
MTAELVDGALSAEDVVTVDVTVVVADGLVDCDYLAILVAQAARTLIGGGEDAAAAAAAGPNLALQAQCRSANHLQI